MRCLGSVQHLKSRFVGGYTLDVQCEAEVVGLGGEKDEGGMAEDGSIVDIVQEYVLNVALRGVSVLKERHGPFLRFDVAGDEEETKSENGASVTLGEIFRKMETMKVDERFRIEDYSVSQCTLEQVFLSLAKDEDHDEME